MIGRLRRLGNEPKYYYEQGYSTVYKISHRTYQKIIEELEMQQDPNIYSYERKF